MNGKAHAAIGFISAAAFGFNPLYGVIGGLLPDCDHPKAPAGKVLPLWLFGIKHRSRWTHSWIPLAVITLITVTTGFDWGLALGYLSHIVADSITPLGVPITGDDKRKYRFIFFPKTKKKR